MLPRDTKEVFKFCRTLEEYALAVVRGVTDPWSEIGIEVEFRHAEIIAKMYAGQDEHLQEVRSYLKECVRLAKADPPTASILKFSSPAKPDIGDGCRERIPERGPHAESAPPDSQHRRAVTPDLGKAEASGLNDSFGV